MQIGSKLRKAITEYQNNDFGAYEIIYEETSNYIFCYISLLLEEGHNKQKVRDNAYINTFVEIGCSINELAEVDEFYNWIRSIASNEVLNLIEEPSTHTISTYDEKAIKSIMDEVIVPYELSITILTKMASLNTENCPENKIAVTSEYNNDILPGILGIIGVVAVVGVILFALL